MEKLRLRFEAACRAIGAKESPDALFDELVARHAEKQRAYHTIEHVVDCLDTLRRFRGLAEREAEVELALFFHDAVYDPLGGDNEEQSAKLASERLNGLGADPEAVERIASYVRATARHDAAAGDAALVVDLDLSILGASPERYERFEGQIRKEYEQVPEDLFREGRRRVLQGFLDRRALYRHETLREALQAQARENLRRAISLL